MNDLAYTFFRVVIEGDGITVRRGDGRELGHIQTDPEGQGIEVLTATGDKVFGEIADAFRWMAERSMGEGA